MKRKSVTRLLAVALSGAMLLSSSPVAYAMEEKQPLEETIIESEPLDADKESLYIDEEVNIESEDLLDNQEPVNDGNMDLSIDSTAVQQVDGAFCDEIIEEDNSEEEIFEEIIDGDLIDSIEYYEEGDSGNQDTITEEYGTYINGGNCGVEGDNLKWAIYDSNNDNLEDLLVISGIGKMRAYSDPNDAPWYGSRYRISEIVLQPGIESVGKYAFTYLPYVESIIIPDGVTCLSDRMVYECANLSYVRIPKTVETMADVFLYTPKLKTAGGIGSGCNIEFGWDDRIPEGAFEECDFLTEVIIPDNITSVGGCAFYGCSNLEHVSIPKNTLDFEYSVFDECDLLVSAGPANSGSNIEFAWQESIPANVFDSSSIRKIEIPDYITTIADGAFYACYNLTNISLPNQLTSIGSNAFRNCQSIKELIIPSSVKIIGDSAFSGCMSKFIFEGNAPKFGTYCFSTSAIISYPYGNPTWNEEVIAVCGENLTWKPHSIGDIVSLSVVTSPNKKMYKIDDEIDITGLELQALYSSGYNEIVPATEVKTIDYDFSTSGKKHVTVFYNGMEAGFEVFVHGMETITIDPSNYPESEHNYPNSADLIYTYNYEGAESLIVVFSADTKFEANVDFLEIYDKDDNLLKKYTGVAAALDTLIVQGDTIKIRLVSDESTTFYGFSFDSITVNKISHICDSGEIVPATCTSQGYTKYICDICGEEYHGNYVPVKEHSWNTEMTVDKEATCNKTGNKSIHCSICDTIQEGSTEEIPAKGHSWNTEKTIDKEATCMEEGSKSIHCGVCDAIKPESQEIIPRLYAEYGIVVDHGSCGTNLVWSVYDADEDGEVDKLVISGKGDMNNYSLGTTPWFNYMKTGKVNVVFDEGITSIGNYAFAVYGGAKSLIGTLSLPEGITRIGEGAFFQCNGLTGDLIIPKGVSRLDKYAFTNCGGFTGTLTLNEGLTSIGEGAFSGCYQFSGSLVLPEGIEVIGKDAFNSCSHFTGELIIPKGVTGISEGAFSVCLGISRLVISEGVLSIGNGAFAGCYSCSMVIIKEPDCNIYSSSSTFPDTIILGYENSTAQAYAEAYGRTFFKDHVLDITIIRDSTCTEEGTQFCKCLICGYNYEASITKKEHTWDKGTITKEATCTEKGAKEYTCTVCKETKAEDIAANGHTWKTEKTVDKEATCTETGSASTHCSICDVILAGSEETLPLKNHDWDTGKVLFDATCTTKGEMEYTCLDCQKTKIEAIPEKGHSWNDGTVTKEATCTEKGEKKYTCTVCEETKAEDITVKGHTWKTEKTVDKEATCTETGTASIHCSVCNAIQEGSQKDLPMGEHSWDGWKQVVAPTIPAEGQEQRVCKVCGTKEYRPIDKLPAELAKVVVGTPKVVSGDHIQISWGAVKGADGYCIYRMVGNKWKKVETVDENVLSYIDTDTKIGTKYAYSVRAYAETEEGTIYSPSNKPGVSITQGFYKDAVKMSYAKALSTKSVKIKWSGRKKSTGYIIYRKTPGGSWKKLATVGKVSSYTDKTCKPATTYQYAVKAYAKVGSKMVYSKMEKTGAVAVTKMLTPKLTVKPTAKRTASLSWTKQSNVGGYVIYRKEGSSGAWEKIKRTSAKASSYKDKGLKSKQTYYYIVKAYKKAIPSIGITEPTYSGYSKKKVKIK